MSKEEIAVAFMESVKAEDFSFNLNKRIVLENLKKAHAEFVAVDAPVVEEEIPVVVEEVVVEEVPVEGVISKIKKALK